ncbi:hypothetical protein CISG_08317 [Coccidioides immitis RMSCC 3703]|uniref:Uncharacterized protein n=1 Tax=Coccidioides immitis RMSCC 3703 TaxID=454286 RepID=A0A0J8R5X0_COCIT|nr:hypothetical protein CISG_08317 [Coccidioides immitis RMSCC 3703]
MFLQVDATSSEKLDVLISVGFWKWCTRSDVGSTAVNLESAHSSHDNDGIWDKAGRAAFDVEETLATHGEVESSFSDNKASLSFMVFIRLGTRQFERELVRYNGISPDTDVGEWTGVDKDRCALQTLHEVWFDCILHQGCQCASNSNVITSNRISILGGRNHHSPKTLSHIAKVVAKG